MGKRVTDFLSNYELLPNLINIEEQEVIWGNSIVPLVIIPALLVQFPFLDEYYCDLVGVPIYSGEKTGQAIELDSKEKIRTMNRLLFFNAFVNRLCEIGLGIRGISEYVGIAMGSAQIADRLMNLDSAENQLSDTTYWYVEVKSSQLFLGIKYGKFVLLMQLLIVNLLQWDTKAILCILNY
ncbi:MAG TPA: hypothetical protein PK957_01415 [Candidatus Dojkabacteria bacterium]|nr:hypothetical protein [Candidatus Dojkabacteria bacterium]HQF36446.1 hypothetical protein [Candidatus Dojkabacteria bacterium]